MEIIQSTPDKWDYFKGKILKLEKNFSKKIRTDKNTHKEIFLDNDSIIKFLKIGPRYIGNIMSYPLKTDKEFEDYNLLVLKQSKVLYIFSFVVNHRYQGKGYGKTLLNDIIKTAREKDYDYVAGHFKIGGSYEIFKRYGPVVVDTFKDWEGSGHDYNFCVLELKGEETWEK